MILNLSPSHGMLRPLLRLVSPASILWFASVAISQDTESVLVEQGRMDVTITSAPTTQRLPTKIHTTFQLRNVSNHADDRRRVIPVAAPPFTNFADDANPWCHVTVNGVPVKIETKVLIKPANRFATDANIKHVAEWTDRINRWILQDAKLSDLVAKYQKLVESGVGLYDLTDESMGNIIGGSMFPF